MLDEPYRWVEAMRNRREYLEDQLKSASPVVSTAYENGLLLLTTTPGPRKLFEIYNQVAFAAIGHPADIEKLRKAMIDIAHVEAFNFSARDLPRMFSSISTSISPSLKRPTWALASGVCRIRAMSCASLGFALPENIAIVAGSTASPHLWLIIRSAPRAGDGWGGRIRTCA